MKDGPEFIALIGHEFRTPLTKIMGYSGLLAAQLQGPDRRLAEATVAAARHMHDLVETIIQFADASTGDLRLDETQVALRKIVEQAWRIQQPVLDGAGKQIQLVEFDVPEFIQADASQLTPVLSALIDNATLHGGPAIEIGARVNKEGDIEISVIDNGDFDSDAAIEDLCKPLVVGDDLNTRRVGGSGSDCR